VEADVPFQRLVVGELGPGAFEDLRDLIVEMTADLSSNR